ncbi:MAG: MFS transporter [Hungatella sp.]|jgi:MFS family permease|nr:MFS transporter [Hungatella sp.]
MDEKNSFRRFLILNVSQSISLVGSGLTDFALSYYILQGVMKSGGQISQYTILYFIMYLPGIIVAPFIGTLVDRSNKKYILVASDTIAAVGSLAILLVYMHDRLQIGHIYAVVLIKALASAFQTPSFQASISILVAKKDYGKAVGLAQVGEAVNRIISPLLAGILFYYTSLEIIIIIDLVCYFIAFILIAPCRMAQLKVKQEKMKLWFLKDCRMGFEVLKKDKLLVSLLGLFVFNNFLISVIQVLVQPLVYVMNEQNGTLISNSLALGIVMTCGGVGMMISSIIMGITGGPQNRISAILIFNGCGGLILMAVIVVKSVLLFAVGTLLYFLTIPFILGSNITIWQARVPVEHQGKVFSIRRACVLGVTPFSSLIAGAVADCMHHYYDRLSFLHGIVNSANGIYALLFFFAGFITLFISVLFKFDRNFKGYHRELKGGLENG